MQIIRNGGRLLILAALLMLAGCDSHKTEEASMPIDTKVNAREWEALKSMRIVFAHQSVGNNILQGVELLNAKNGGNLTIHEQGAAPASRGISHFTIGENGDPLSKIKDFAAVIDAGAAQNADVALMKLCYVDFNAATDAEQLADSYSASLDSLARRHPGTKFIAVTAPLTTVQTGPKAWIKRLLGKQPAGYIDNFKRWEFNIALRKRYLATGRLFDLARAEVDSAGKSCQVDVNGQTVEALCPELTDDGGHLNERGQERVAAAFLNFVGSLSTLQASH